MKKTLPRYHPESIKEGEKVDIISGYDSYVELLKSIHFHSDLTGVEIVENGPCDEAIDVWYIITKRRTSSSN